MGAEDVKGGQRPAQSPAAAYGAQAHDAVRAQLEAGFFARLVQRLLAEAGGGRLLDLGCGDGLAARLAGPALTEYTGVDFRDDIHGGRRRRPDDVKRGHRPPLQPDDVKGGHRPPLQPDDVKGGHRPPLQPPDEVEGELVATHRVYRPGAADAVTVQRTGPGAFRVSGERVERLLARHDLSNDESLRYLEDRLRSMGVIKSLVAKGFEPGDDVEIAGTVFELETE